jgi:hypothetical protein
MATDPHEDPVVRTRAAEFLALIDKADPEPLILEILTAARDSTEAGLILNTAVMLTEPPRDFRFDLSSIAFPEKWLSERGTKSSLARRINYVQRYVAPR